jgi:hypothetical protein
VVVVALHNSREQHGQRGSNYESVCGKSKRLAEVSVPKMPQRKDFAVTISQPIVVTIAFGLGLTLARTAWAVPASETCTALAEARNSLYSMLHTKDKSEQDALVAKTKAASMKVDTALARMTGADAQVATDIKAVWDQFTATRDNEIIPLIRQGNIDDAKKIANGIQFQRFSRIWSMSCSR